MFIAFSAKVREGKYVKGPSVGLWPRDTGPEAGGSLKGEYLEQLVEFLNKACDKGSDVSVALFKGSKKFGKRQDEEDEEGDDDDDEEEEEEKPSRSRRSKKEDEDEEDEDEKPRRGSKGKAASKGKGKKKDDWGFDD